jgi:hypothetical protein
VIYKSKWIKFKKLSNNKLRTVKKAILEDKI